MVARDDAVAGAGGREQTSNGPWLVIGWLWVGVPALWGIWHVIQTSAKLFR